MMEENNDHSVEIIKSHRGDVLETIILFFLIDVDKLFSVQKIGSSKKGENTSTFKFISFRSVYQNMKNKIKVLRLVVDMILVIK